MSKTYQPDIRSTADGTAFYALVCLIPIFVVVVTYGWTNILKPVLPVDSPIDTILALIAGLFLALVGVVLAKIIAADRIQVLLEGAGKLTLKAWFARCWAYFLVLVVISALGTARTFFSVSQASDVLRAELSATDGKLRDLQVAINKLLATPEYDAKAEEYTVKRSKVLSLVKQFETEMQRVKDDELAKLNSKRARIDNLWAQFVSEATNPLNCGFGQEASKHFRELNLVLGEGSLKPLSGNTTNCKITAEAIEKNIKPVFEKAKESVLVESKYNCGISPVAAKQMVEIQAALPGLKPLEASTIPCSNVSKIVSDYTKEAYLQIKKITVPETDSPVAILAFKKKATNEIQEQLLSIEQLLSQNKVSSDTALPVLRKSWDVYRKNLSEAETLAEGKRTGLAKDIKREEIENIDNLSNILRILLSRWDNFMTYLTLFAALLLDMILIAFFGRHLSSRVKKTESSPYEEFDVGDNIFKS